MFQEKGGKKTEHPTTEDCPENTHTRGDTSIALGIKKEPHLAELIS